MRVIYVARKVFGLINKIFILILFRPNNYLHKIGAKSRLLFEDLGGVYIKFGQILALRRDILPDDVCDELSKLLEEVPPEIAKALRTVLTGDSIVAALNPGIKTDQVLKDMYKISLASSYQLLKSKINQKSIQKILIKGLDFLDYELSSL